MKNSTLRMTFLLCALLGLNFAMAQRGAPHTLRGESKVASVLLKWKSPTADKTMQWHNDVDFDGMSGVSQNGEIPQLYIANRFDKNDLKEYNGAVIDSICYFHYRPVLSVTVLLYENEKVVREQKVNVSNFKLDKMHSVLLDEPYTVHDNVDITVAVKFEHGTNIDFVGIMDRGPGVPGKGDLYSYDGKNWKNIKRGNFLVTAHIEMPEVLEPNGYNVYRGDTKVNTDFINSTSVVLKNEPKGTYDYSVKAVYIDKEYKSNVISLTNIPAIDARPVVNNLRTSVDGLNATITWRAPILADKSLTWCNGEADKAMGSTSGAVRRLWVVNSFANSEMLSYADHQITAINAMFNAAVTSVKLVIFEDGIITYSEDVPEETVKQIKLNEWTKFSLTTPFKIDPSADFKIGYYMIHAANAYPAKLDKGLAVKNGCYISSSTPKDDFNKTQPTWNLLEKSTSANWMLSADIVALSDIPTLVVKDYDIYRNGAKVHGGVTGNTYTEEIEPGIFDYAVVTNYTDGSASAESDTESVKIELPGEYMSPTLTDKSFDKGQLSLKWDVFTDLPPELKHYGTPAYYYELGNEGKDVDVYIGAEFSVDELAPYSNHEITGVNLMLANDFKSMTVMLYSDGTTLASKTVTSVDKNQMTAILFDAPVAVPVTGKSLVVGYHILYEDGKYPITLDEGPLVSGGAMLSFDGKKWYNLGMVDKTATNVVIGAMVRLKGAADANSVMMNTKSLTTGTKPGMLRRTDSINYDDLKQVTTYGLDKVEKVQTTYSNKPQVKNFRVYCNGTLVKELEEKEYAITLPYGTYSYAVTAVYTNGWESGPSASYDFEYKQANLTQAPYGLSGTLENNDLSLIWQSPELSKELNYQNKTSGSKAVGLTKSSGVEGYFLISYSANELSDKVGEYITHIKYGLYDTNLNASSIVVYYDRNLVYEQKVDVATLVKGENVIRLDKPVVIPADREVCVGYYVAHANGVKPNLTDEGPAVDGKGNWICTGTSWKTLKSMNKDLDYNWRIAAVLQKADVIIPTTRAGSGMVTYTLYLNGVMLAENITGTNYVVKNAADGIYTVTASVDGVISAPSNEVVIGNPTGIVEVGEMSKAYYNSSLEQVILSQEAHISLFNANGILLNKTYADKLDLSELASGMYIVSIGNNTDNQIIKVVK